MKNYYLEEHTLVIFVINEDTDIRREYQACTHDEDGFAVYSAETLLNDKVHLYNLSSRAECIQDAKNFAAKNNAVLVLDDGGAE